MLVATIMFSIACALTFELARLTAACDYRGFFRVLLGRFWIAYEIAYLVLCLLVLSVLGAAAGEVAATHLGLPPLAGSLLLMACIGALSYRGTSLIETALAGWSFVLYATYAALVAAYLWRFGDNLAPAFAAEAVRPEWLQKGLAYFGYNAAIIPLVLFVVRHMRARADAFTAGALAGPLVMIPAVLLFLAMATDYPAIVDAAVPADFMLQRLGLPWLQLIFYVVVFGTFIETGTGFVHALNERVAGAFRENGRSMPDWLRAANALAALLAATVLAGGVGLIDLIAKGYGTLTWAFILVFVLPLLTVGAHRILTSPSAGAHPGQTPA